MTSRRTPRAVAEAAGAAAAEHAEGGPSSSAARGVRCDTHRRPRRFYVPTHTCVCILSISSRAGPCPPLGLILYQRNVVRAYLLLERLETYYVL